MRRTETSIWEALVGVKPTFCSICNRSVYVGHSDSLTCPVCSTPLLEGVAVDEDVQ